MPEFFLGRAQIDFTIVWLPVIGPIVRLSVDIVRLMLCNRLFVEKLPKFGHIFSNLPQNHNKMSNKVEHKFSQILKTI